MEHAWLGVWPDAKRGTPAQQIDSQRRAILQEGPSLFVSTTVTDPSMVGRKRQKDWRWLGLHTVWTIHRVSRPLNLLHHTCDAVAYGFGGFRWLCASPVWEENIHVQVIRRPNLPCRM